MSHIRNWSVTIRIVYARSRPPNIDLHRVVHDGDTDAVAIFPTVNIARVVSFLNLDFEAFASPVVFNLFEENSGSPSRIEKENV